VRLTICLTYFRSLTLANLSAALHSVRQQDLQDVAEVVVIDNNTDDAAEDIQSAIDAQKFPIPVRLQVHKHGCSDRTHSWSTNMAVRGASTEWVLFTRADYILAHAALTRFVEVAQPTTFITGRVYHLTADIDTCEKTAWRKLGASMLRTLPGVEEKYMEIDAGVWMLQREVFHSVQGLDETLVAWGHAQTHFQHKLYNAGVAFAVVPEVLYYHPAHGGAKDIELAHQQLRNLGLDIRQLWARYGGAQPY